MSNLKIFLSSTYYDLSVVRSELKVYFENLGHAATLSEFGDILYDPKNHTHKSCIESVDEHDVLVVLIGGRFGGEVVPEVYDSLAIDALGEDQKLSITQTEVMRAFECGIPVYILVDKQVYNSRETYNRNKSNKDVDVTKLFYPGIEKQESARYIFEFINYLVRRKSNNAIETYEDLNDIKSYLSKQWSQLFAKLLRERKHTESMENSCEHDKLRDDIITRYKPNSYIPLKDNFCDVANRSRCETSIYPNILVMGDYVDRVHFSDQGYEFNGKNMLSVHYKENLPKEREERSFVFAMRLTQLPSNKKPVFFFSYGRRVSHKCGDGVNNHDKSFGLFYGEPAPEEENDAIPNDYQGEGLRIFFYCEKCREDRVSDNCDTKVIREAIGINEWIYFSITYNGQNELKLYMNGELVFDETYVLQTSETPYLNLGGFVHHNENGAMIARDFDYTMQGYLREFMVFKNRCLSKEEIGDLNDKIEKLL